jgi:hypothetical protein
MAITGIQVKSGLWSNSYLSALGQNTGGGGGGGVTLNEPLASINTASLGSPTTAGQVITWNGSAWVYRGRRVKTGVPFVSQLLQPVVDVLERYGGIVPRMDNADYNHELKTIGLLAQSSLPLHSHLARHTFATWMLANGVKVENLKRMLGHKNIAQTMRYAKVLDQSVIDEYLMIEAKLDARGQ